jgi:hypothetical protein
MRADGKELAFGPGDKNGILADMPDDHIAALEAGRGNSGGEVGACGCLGVHRFARDLPGCD